MNKIILVCALLISLSLIFVEGTVSTKILTPSSVDLCGNYSQAVVVSALGVQNSDNATLSNVVATLNLSNSSGLRFVTSKDVALGSISPFSNSSTNPQWTLECTGTSSGSRTATVTYTNSGETAGNGSIEPTSTIILHSPLPIDTTPPQIMKYGPLATLTESSTKITLTTNEVADCKYSTSSNTAFDVMTSLFTKVDATNFETQISGLAEGKKSFFVRCRDAAGNINQEDYKIDLTVDFKPTAKITLSDPSPVKPGVIAVTLTTSETMKLAPSLQYVLGSSLAVSIPLSGSGNSWKGYMVLSADSNNQVGTFLFKGKDLGDNEGTEITENNIFLVQLEGLDPPLLVDASSDGDKSITLKWFYSNTNAVSFNLYRSLKKDVSYLDYYQNVANTLSNIKTFTDSNVDKGVTYHYAISVIDGSGDEGLLSQEAWVMAGSGVQTSVDGATENPEAGATTGQENKEGGSATLNITLLSDTISSLLDKIDQKKTYFKEQKGEIAAKTGVQEVLSEEKTELLKLKNDVNDIFGKAASPEVTATFQSLQNRIELVGKRIPEDVMEGDAFKTLSWTAPSSIQINASIAALEKEKKKTLTPSQRDDLLRELMAVQQNFNIKGTEEHYVVSYKDSRKEFLSVISEKITPLKAVLTSSTIVALFPETVNASRDVLLMGKNLKRLGGGNGFLYDINQFKDIELLYAVKSADKSDSTQEGEVVVIPFSFSQNIDSKSGNSLTGFAVGSLNPVSWSMNTLMIVLSVILVSGLGGYYLNLNRKSSSSSAKGHSSGDHSAHSVHSSSTGALSHTLVNSRFSFIKHKNHHLPQQLPSDHSAHSRLNNSLSPVENRLHQVQSEAMGQSSPENRYRSAIPHYSLYSSTDYQKAGLSSLAEGSNQHLLLKLGEFIHQLDYDAAIKFHHQLALVPQGTLKDKEEKLQLEKLEKKLNLLAWMEQLPFSLERRDHHQMRSILNKISAIYNETLAGKLPAAEAEFALRVREVYDRYAQEVIQKYG